VDDAGLPQMSEKLSEFSASPIDDIPEAVRETAAVETRSSLKRSLLLWGLGGLGTISLIAVPLLVLQAKAPAPQPVPLAQSNGNAVAVASLAKDVVGQAIATVAGDSNAAPLLGHLPYQEAPQSELQPVTSDGSISLRRVAAEKYEEMVADAKADGVTLVPISGFRSISEQERVFFDLKAERGEGITTRAEVSAPPGYSEHHTGYAVDIGDADHPGANLQFDFEDTQAFQWLKQNAAHYNFEMSFPKNNPMGVSYEPWHWRFVGDRSSLETFYRARTLDNPGQPNSGQTQEQPAQEQTNQKQTSRGQASQEQTDPDQADQSSTSRSQTNQKQK
jgi:D-alanyl-D-alanine carboxypeptidase